ncbi:hypothetical protein PQR57_04090 [Paraburkholderia dipogonis]|uniref:Uncharacterized protein n=1 Tax=Paraburkholderia dipogonis TaxID=1211383 RepID=A0ABW9AHW0_9BURK
MTPQEIQLLSDSVKIGIPVIGTIAGAAVGAISTYFLTRITHRHEHKEEFSKRKFDLIMQTATDVTEFEHIMGVYTTAVSNKIQGFKLSVDFDEAKSNAHNKSQSIRRARMALKILGLTEAEQELEKYIVLTREVMRFSVNLSKERATELTRQIGVGPSGFYVALSKEIETHQETH